MEKAEKGIFLFGNADTNAKIIARIAVMIAVTVVLQLVSNLFGQQLITGAIVNMCLLLSVMLTGLIGGIIVGAVTPLLAVILGIAPQLLLAPFIAVGNALYITTFALLSLIVRTPSKGEEYKKLVVYIFALATASVGKFLYMSLVSRWLFPLFLPTAQAQKLAVMWGITQLFTALLGGAIAIGLSYPLERLHMLGRLKRTPKENNESAESK